MEIGINSAKSMQESVVSVYERLWKVVSVHCKLNETAMIITQSMGYNGFKRWHRVNARKMFALRTCLANDLFDKFRIPAEIKDFEISYSPKSMEEHLKSWEKAVLEAIEETGAINREYFGLTGASCDVAERIIGELTHDFEKIGRYIRRFTESEWLTLDMHTVDDRLHDKYKDKEADNPWTRMLSYGLGQRQ